MNVQDLIKGGADNAKLIKSAGVVLLVVGGILILVKVGEGLNSILELLGVRESDEDKEQKRLDGLTDNANKDALKEALKYAELSYPNAVYANAADVIDENTKSNAIYDNDSIAINAIIKTCQNAADWYKLVNVFGRREHWHFVSQGTRTLPELISQEFSDSERKQIRDQFTFRNIPVVF